MKSHLQCIKRLNVNRISVPQRWKQKRQITECTFESCPVSYIRFFSSSFYYYYYARILLVHFVICSLLLRCGADNIFPSIFAKTNNNTYETTKEECKKKICNRRGKRVKASFFIFQFIPTNKNIFSTHWQNV